jgi:hypothetical protein
MHEGRSSDEAFEDTFGDKHFTYSHASLLDQLRAWKLSEGGKLLPGLLGSGLDELDPLAVEETKLTPANFPGVPMDQACAYKILQKQMNFGKGLDAMKSYKSAVEDMEAVYRGDVVGGKKHGIGEAVGDQRRQVMEDGTLIGGEFKNDQPNGSVALVSPSGFGFVGKVTPGEGTGSKNFLGQFIPKGGRLERIDRGIGAVFGDDGTRYFGAFVDGRP